MFGIVFLMFICMSLLFVAKRIRFFAVMAVLFAGLTLMLYSGTLYQIIMANYDARNILDKYNIVQKINAFFKSGITDLRFISLIGETAILFSYVLTGIFLLERKRWLYGLLLIPVIFYFVISLPQVSYSFYLVMNSHRSNDLIYIIYEVCLWTKRFSAAGCFIFPVAVCIIRYYNTILWIAKRQLIILVSCIGTISLVLLFFIMKGMINSFFDLNVNIFYKQVTLERLNVSNFYLMLIILIIVVSVIFLFGSNVLGGYASVTRFSLFVDDYKMEKNLRMVLHTYKNAFLMIKKSADMIERDEADISIVKQRVSTIDNIAENALYTITAHMEMIKQIDTDFQKFNIEVETCRAIKKVLINKSAEVEFISSMNDKCINSDPFYFSEIVYNIFLNAVEAVEGVKDPKIMVKLTEEKNWFLLEIRDNGRGIEKHKIKDIFMPLYSEKCGPNNWGIGLYYVRKIVRALSGYLFVESKPGDYTVFRVYLPKNIEKERRFFVWN